MTALLALSPGQVALLAAIAFLAGLVRGFSGFGLSALVMSVSVLILPPIELIPMLWFLEMAASLVMFRGGLADADRPVAFGLTAGAAVGLPIGLLMTLSLPVATSRMLALAILLALATAQLARIRLPVLATRPGLAASGLTAGVATGLAGVGGMVIALYMLARELPPRAMRGSLSVYMLAAGLLGLLTHLALGTMDATATIRGLAFITPTLLGLAVGRALFTPRFEPYYRPVCLALLIGLASVGLIRLA